MRNVTHGMLRRSEAEVQYAVVDYLRVVKKALVAITDAGLHKRVLSTCKAGIPCRRPNVRGTLPGGFPDLIVLLPGGRFMGIECKSETGRQSAIQKLMQQQFEDLGHEYVLARNVDDVIAAIERENDE